MMTRMDVWMGVGRVLRPGWLVGPIFDKELRVSSRRRRNYVLRVGYVVLLLLFVVSVWLGEVQQRGYQSAVYSVSRMAAAGKLITGVVVWFQFIALQLLAIVMLSTAISDEIYNRTLGVLMTTPINSLQIVLGKLLSKLWQMMLLMAVSLPVLAIVRVFGGVPWDFVAAGLVITLTTIVFMGSLSLYFSIHSRRAYAAIMKTMAAVGVLFAFLPWAVFMLLEDVVNEDTLIQGICYFHPYGAMGLEFHKLMAPGQMPFAFSWGWHCAAMLGTAGLVLGLSVRVVRKVALRQATGQIEVSMAGRRRRWKRVDKGKGDKELVAAEVRRVTGAPILWKELRTPMLRSGRVKKILLFVGALALLVISYGLCESEGDLDDGDTHLCYVVIFVGMGAVGAAVLGATGITTEKESRSWPLLLGTTVSDWDIIIGKGLGAIRRSTPYWSFLVVHLAIFTAVGFIHPISSLHLAILAAWLTVFFVGAGLYFSSLFRHTTTAVIMNLGLGILLWAFVPFVMLMCTIIGDMDDDIVEASIVGNPLVPVVVTLEGAFCRPPQTWYQESVSDNNFNWPYVNNLDIWETTWLMMGIMAMYMGIGLVFAWRAKCRLRRGVF